MSILQKTATLSRNDIRMIFRDRTLLFMLSFPFLSVLFLRYTVPWLVASYPVMADYLTVLLAMTCATTGTLPAYVVAFVMLDEKDADVLTALRTMPISNAMFLTYRLCFVFFWSWLLCIITIALSGIVALSMPFTILVSVLFALLSVLVMLPVVTYADNKIEGLTFVKGINLIVILPMLTFFTKSIWVKALALFPSFWIFKAFNEESLNPDFWLFFGVGVVVHLLLIFFFFQQFKNRVWEV